MIDWIKEQIYYHGFKVGLVLIASPIAKDLVLKSAREWNLVSIGVVGVGIQILGLVLMMMGGRDAA